MERTGCVSQSSAWKPPLACFDQEQIAADRALGEVVPNNRKRSTTELHRKGFPRGAVGLAGEGDVHPSQDEVTSDCSTAAVPVYLEGFLVNDSQQRAGNSLQFICNKGGREETSRAVGGEECRPQSPALCV